MDFLFVITTPDALRILAPMARACRRQGARWTCFFTNDGVQVLEHKELRTLLPDSTQSVACEYSWKKFMGTQACPVELGSQTDCSRMMGEADKVVSL